MSDSEETLPREQDEETGASVGVSGERLHLFQGFVGCVCRASALGVRGRGGKTEAEAPVAQQSGEEQRKKQKELPLKKQAAKVHSKSMPVQSKPGPQEKGQELHKVSFLLTLAAMPLPLEQKGKRSSNVVPCILDNGKHELCRSLRRCSLLN